MFNPLALSRTAHYLENALRLAVLAELAYENDAKRALGNFPGPKRIVRSFHVDGTFGFLASDDRNLVLALRGTDEITDWVTNLTVAQEPGLGGKVHKGFAASLTRVWKEIVSHLAAALDRAQTVWVTGHSLGGALATVAAARLLTEGIEPYVTCTFGAPRCLDPKAAAGYLPRLFRFVTKGDLVPSMPPPLTLPWYWYQHTGNLAVVLDKDRNGSARVDGPGFDAFSLARWLNGPTLVDLKETFAQRLADHAMKTYIGLIKQELGPDMVARLERGEAAVEPARVKPRRALAA